MPARRILLIDDEEDIREVVQVVLEMMAGWEVFQARSGREGLNRATIHRPDLILLDVMMPGMDGPATLQALRSEAKTCRIPVVFLTAKAQSADRSRLDQLGVAGVITKPFDFLQLPGQVAGAAGWSI